MMRTPLIVAATLLLAGCWYGNALFSASDSRPLVPAGVYNSTEPGETTHRVRVVILPNGLARVDDPSSDDGDAVYGFIPLNADGSRFLGWMSKGADSERGETQLYFLGEKRGAEFDFFVPECKGADAEMAMAAGAKVEGSEPSCGFSTKAALLRAAAQIHSTGHDMLRLQRITG